jgi:D-sedoheptulose 7-phosphate isomerase
MSINDEISKQLNELGDIVQLVTSSPLFVGQVAQAIKLIDKCFARGNKLLLAGNGGSAAEAQHFASEIVGRFRQHRKPYPALALTTDTSILTAIGNDYQFLTIFSRQVEAHGKKGDVFIAISTSGNSKNIIHAAETARRLGLTIISITGNRGKLAKISDLNIAVPSSDTPRIQEIHNLLTHVICQEVEKNFKSDD